jgi:hypothetical protein
MDDADSVHERARGRNDWPIRRLAPGDDGDDLSEVTTATERIAMMWPLALEAWSLAGLPIPDYPREAAPIRRLRLVDPDCESGRGEG